MTLRPAEEKDAEAFVDHYFRHGAESGKNGEIVFSPLESEPMKDRAERIEARRKMWTKPLGEPGWQRAWVLEEAGVIRGNVTCSGGVLPTCLHRARVGLGIEKDFRGLGHGLGLAELALAWARGQDALFWAECSVYSHNQPMRKLVEQLGFQAYGMIMDRYRVYGVSVDEILYCLQLREE